MERASVLPRIQRMALVALALVLPFEVPLARVGPLQLTSVELVLYLAVAVGGVGVLLRPRSLGRILREPGTAPALVWVAVLFASALLAGAERSSGLKFALRSTGGVLVFFVAREATRDERSLRMVVRALLAGSLLSAATALLDVLVPSSAALWAPFRAGPFTTFGLRRATGVFAYPTLGAMAWEASVPLLVGVATRGAHRARSLAGVVAGGGMLVAAILASGTRTALVGAFVGGLGLWGLAGRVAPGSRRLALGFLAAGTTMVAGLLVLSGEPLAERLRFWRSADDWYRAEYLVEAGPRTASPGDALAFAVLLRNRGTITWPHDGVHRVRLGYHLERAGTEPRIWDFDGLRTPLGEDVPPAGEAHVVASVMAPTQAGRYRVRFDLAQEGVTWFSQRGCPTGDVELDVGEAAAEVLAPPLDLVPTGDPPPPPRRALWAAAIRLWRTAPWLGIGPDAFRRRYSSVLETAPGGRPFVDDRLHANSLYFETLADLGLAGVIALAGVFVSLLRRLAHLRVRGTPLHLACGVAAGLFFVHGALDYFFEFTPLYGLFWLLFGLACAPLSAAGAPAGTPP